MCAKKPIQLRAYEKKQVEWAAAYIRNQLSDNLDATTVACMARISAYKLKAGFLQVFRKSFADYVKEERMLKAQDLLLHTNELVAEVARQCGYRNESSFHRAFKQWNGETPDRFRKR